MIIIILQKPVKAQPRKKALKTAISAWFVLVSRAKELDLRLRLKVKYLIPFVKKKERLGVQPSGGMCRVQKIRLKAVFQTYSLQANGGRFSEPLEKLLSDFDIRFYSRRDHERNDKA